MCFFIGQATSFMKLSFLHLLPFIIFFTALTFMVSDHIFFWDTVQLGAKHGLHFYDTNFSKILLPDMIDSGHVPVFGMYLALMWMIFGKSLFVSHFAMLPFLVGIVVQSYFLVKRYVPQHFLLLALSIFLLDPTLLGQSTLISPDIPLVFFFLLSLNSILNNQRILLTFGITGLFLISMRGGMISFALLMLDLFFNFRKSTHRQLWTLVKMSWSYLPGFLLFCAYNYLHYTEKNWIGYHTNSPWAPSFQHVDIYGFLKNVVVLAWRMFDFGRVFLWIIGIWLASKYFPKFRKDDNIKELLIIFWVLITCSSISFLSYVGLNAHRYILPVYLSFSLLIIYMIFNSELAKKTWVVTFLCIGLLSGHLWVYPAHISQGWDGSLAHVHYFELREKIMFDIKSLNINIPEIACVYPNNSEQKYMDLSENTAKHTPFDHEKSKYVLYSNVYNDFTDEDLKVIEDQYKVIRHHQKMGVFMILYVRK
jgi:hypothetical protein